jgi:DNA modification methylase
MPTLVEGVTKIVITDIIVSENFRKDMGDLLSLANSMSVNGLINPVVVDRTNNLVAGKRRLEAAKMLKWTEIEARIYEELSPAERRKVEIEEDIAQKKTRSWQEEVALKKELHTLLMAEKGVRKKGKHGKRDWSQKDTANRLGVAKNTLSEDLRLADAMLMFPELSGASTKTDAIKKMYILRERALLKAISKQMQELGVDLEEDVELKYGDAYVLLKELKDESMDCCITDPPWGIEIQDSGSARSIDYEMFKDTKDVWTKFLNEGLPEIFRILKEGSHMWLFFGPEFYKETRDALEKVGFDVRYVPTVWIKEKPNYTDWEYKPMPQYESIFFAVRRKDKSLSPRRLNEATSDVFQYARNTGDRIHRTEKPVELIKRLIHLSTYKNDRILDPFAGSASTLCAALLTQRKALGFELGKELFDTANGRLKTLKMETISKVEDEDEEEEEKEKEEDNREKTN